jgi:hypothetical protein
MALLEFLGTMVFVAIALLSLVAVLDIFVPRRIPALSARRSSNQLRARKLAKANTRVQ